MTHVPPVAEIKVATATVRVWRDHIDSEYEGGFVSSFWPGHGNVEESEVARAMTGYWPAMAERHWMLRGDDMLVQYGLEHDLFHHLVAAYVTMYPHSRVVWGDAHKALDAMRDEDDRVSWPLRLDDEEYMVNAAQRWFNTGRIDAPHAGLAEIMPPGDRQLIRSIFSSYLKRSGLRA